MPQFRIGENSNSSNNNNSFNSNILNNNTNSFNTTTINNTINNTISVEERDEILNWLSTLDPQIRHQNIREHRVEHVGAWLLGTEEYQNWRDGIHGGERNNSTLFCYGDPGVGKTYIR